MGVVLSLKPVTRYALAKNTQAPFPSKKHHPLYHHYHHYHPLYHHYHHYHRLYHHYQYVRDHMDCRYGQIISTKAILDKATNRCKVRLGF